MLFRLLDEVGSKISVLDIDKDAPAFAKQLAKANPEFAKAVREGMPSGTSSPSEAGAGIFLQLIKEIPEIVNVMVAEVNSRKTTAALRCSLVGGLAYLVQPHDLVPDNSPGGYGFVDDALLLRALRLEHLAGKQMPESAIKHEKMMMAALSLCLPKQIMPMFTQSIANISAAYQMTRMLPPSVLNMTTQLIINNPLTATMPTPPGFKPNPVYSHNGSIRGGAWVETSGRDTHVMFGGGGGVSMVGGKIFVT